MAEFIYKDYSCKLIFGGLEYELPLNEQTAAEMDRIFSDKVLPTKFEGIADIDNFYNCVMDGIDELLGEGAAESIMSKFNHAGALEVLSVVQYISSEFNARYKEHIEEMKKTANIPNRETRRSTPKGGRR